MTKYQGYKKPRKLSWKSFIVLFAVLIIAGGLKAKSLLWPDVVVPTADVPAVTFDQIRDDQEPEVETPSGSPVAGGEGATDGEPVDGAPAQGSTETSTPTAQIPTSFNLAVPFTSQAPYGVWDALHEDACEEASFYMVTEFYGGNTLQNLDPAVTDPVLKAMVAYEEIQGLTPSITAAESVRVLKDHVGVTARIIENPTAEDIKALIAKGYPVIVPAAGRELGNPFFTGEGPLYHMLVLRGYTETTFIANDPGTRHGRNYTYTIPVLMEAIGDWEGGNPGEGAKRILVIEPK